MERAAELENRRICRICLSQEIDANFSDIFDDNIPMQILSIGSVEVFQSDGMPRKICEVCKTILGNAYKFKQIVKRSDTLLKMYPITGNVPPRIEIPQEMLPKKEPEKIRISKSIGVGSESLDKREIGTQTDMLPKIADIDKMEVINYEDVAIIAPPAQFSTEEDFELIDVKNPTEKFVQESVKILNKSKTPSTPPKQFKKTSNVRIDRTDSVKPKILNSLKTSNFEESFVKVAPVVEETSHSEYTLNQPIEEEYLEEIDWEIEKNDKDKNQDKSDDQIVYTCDVCERSFPLQQQLVIHRKNHERERNHPCNDCDKSFFTKYDLAKHVLTHTKQKDYTCIICKKSFSRSTLLYRHEKIHTDPKIKRHQCRECERVYLNIADYEKHIVTHKKNRPFACAYCEKSFAFKQGLERHEVSHDYNSQPHPCQYCDLRFPSTARLQRHLSKEHAGTRPFPCGKCSKRFMLSHHLYRHMTTAHPTQEITTFQCPECEEMFDSRDDFFEHCTMHASSDLPFTCPLCKTEFDKIEDVKEHIVVHSKSDMYYCDYCNLIYMTQDELNSHYAEQHSLELCSVGEELEIIVEDKSRNVEAKKRKKENELQKDSKKQKQDVVVYDIEELDFEDYIESEIDGAAFVEYEEIVKFKPEDQFDKHSQKRKSYGKSEESSEPSSSRKNAKVVEKVKMSSSKIEQLKKEGKIQIINGNMVMKS